MHVRQDRTQVADLTVTLPDELGRLSGVSGLQLTGRHDDGADVQLLVGQGALEGLSLSLASPDTCHGAHNYQCPTQQIS